MDMGRKPGAQGTARRSVWLEWRKPRLRAWWDMRSEHEGLENHNTKDCWKSLGPLLSARWGAPARSKVQGWARYGGSSL